MRVRKNPWRIARKTLLIGISIGAVVFGILALLWYLNRDVNPVPQDIRQALTFSPLVVPSDNDRFETTSFRLSRGEDNTQIFEYILVVDETRVHVASSVQPPQFTDIPEYRDRFLTNIVMQNTTIPTASGTLYVGQLPQQNNEPVGVLLESGLVVFMWPEKPLDESTWRSIGDALVVARS